MNARNRRVNINVNQDLGIGRSRVVTGEDGLIHAVLVPNIKEGVILEVYPGIETDTSQSLVDGRLRGRDLREIGRGPCQALEVEINTKRSRKDHDRLAVGPAPQR